MEVVPVEEAVGNVLCHDITRIVPGKFKGRAFKKGHIIAPEDIPELLKLGKEHIYVWKVEAGKVHENEAGVRLAKAVCGPGLILTEPQEGKVNLIAEHDGLCVIDETSLLQVNMIEELIVSTRNNHRPVKQGEIIAAVRVVPLVINENKLVQAEKLGQANRIVSVQPFHSCKVGLITTGSEVYHGRIQDQFGPVVQKKAEAYGCQVMRQIIVPDDVDQIAQAVTDLLNSGAELILTTGGMSVDPDDVTPAGIRQAGAKLVAYGVPVLPGAMLMIAYLRDVPILGLPGCVMYNKTTVFDLVLPLVLSGQRLTRFMVVKLGLGGLCLKCEVCRFPVCPLGTGA